MLPEGSSMRPIEKLKKRFLESGLLAFRLANFSIRAAYMMPRFGILARSNPAICGFSFFH